MYNSNFVTYVLCYTDCITYHIQPQFSYDDDDDDDDNDICINVM